jgi:hypothetical protein
MNMGIDACRRRGYVCQPIEKLAIGKVQPWLIKMFVAQIDIRGMRVHNSYQRMA